MNGNDNFLLDTNIVLGFLKGNEKIISILKKYNSKQFYVSQITRMKLLGYNNLTNEEESCIKQFLSITKILSISDHICDQAIFIRKQTRLKLPDALIASTAFCLNLILITCDIELLSKVNNIKSINPSPVIN